LRVKVSWGLYQDLWSGGSPDIVGYADGILRVIEDDVDRLRASRDTGQLNPPDDLVG
jgi:hypothetical protein